MARGGGRTRQAQKMCAVLFAPCSGTERLFEQAADSFWTGRMVALVGDPGIELR